ncbi:MAG: response regulator [Nitrospirota bacterium]
MSERILFVDDEANVLAAFQRQLRKDFRINTALGGEQALRIIEHNGPFAVVVCDMRMPEMNGVDLLAEMYRRTPESVRVMLTGNADQQTAINAVNEGRVFRFLTKPCDRETLASTLRAALEQHRLITAEQQLLEETLNGATKLVTDVLSTVAPELFGQAVALRELAGSIARALGIPDPWEVELAAMLSPIGTIAVPPETFAKCVAGEPLDPHEEEALARVPEVGHDLLANIPRLTNVAQIVLFHNKRFDGSGFPPVQVAGDAIPIGARILRVVADLAELESAGMSRENAVERMRGRQGRYDPVALDAAAFVGRVDTEGAALGPPLEVRLNELRPGQTLMANVETDKGRLLVAAGTHVTEPIVERLRSYARLMKIREPIPVRIPRRTENQSHAVQTDDRAVPG